MRHRKSGRRLSRNSAHRKAMFRNMAASLFRYEQIHTTLPKAKELRRVAEPLITMAKNATVANRRLAYARLRDREAVGKLFDDLGVRFKDRNGGYLRILKTGFRPGDTAPMALVQLVEMQSALPEPTREDAKAKQAKKAEKQEKAKKAEAKESEKEKPAKKKAQPAAKKKAAPKKKAATKKKVTTKKKAVKKKKR